MRAEVGLLALIYSWIVWSSAGAVLAGSARRAVASAHSPAVAQRHPLLFSELPTSPVGNSTQKISEDDPSTAVYGVLIDAFEKLGLITPQKKTCYTVKKIIREVFSEDSRRPRRTLGVYLYIEESIINEDPALRTNTPDTDSNVDNPEYKELVEQNISRAEKIEHRNSAKDAECQSSPIITIKGVDIMAPSNGTTLSEGNGAANKSGGMISAQTVDGHAGLSKTQVMVISTCSAVIGTFFIVAAIMRVRNYMKRVREERDMDQHPNTRSCSVAMRGSSQSQAGSDSLLASPNRQMGSGGDSDDSENHFQPNQGEDSRDPLLTVVSRDEDCRPVLVITSASISNSPTSSGRCSQEIHVDLATPSNTAHTEKPPEKEQDDGKDTEFKPFLSNAEGMVLNSDLQGVTFPFMDSPLCEDVPQTCDSIIEGSSAVDSEAPPILENGLAPEMQNSATGYAGLSQSDTSLSLNNPSYCYGNQVEYVNECDYGGNLYIPDEMVVNGLYNGLHDDDPYNRIDSYHGCTEPSNHNPSYEFNYAEEGKLTPMEELPPPPPELFRDLSLDDSAPQYNIRDLSLDVSAPQYNINGSTPVDQPEDSFGVDRNFEKVNRIDLEENVAEDQLYMTNKPCMDRRDRDSINVDSALSEDSRGERHTVKDEYNLYNSRVTPTDSPKYNDRTSLL